MRRALFAAVALLLASCGGGGEGDEDREAAIAAAGNVYAEAVDSGLDLANGPCLADPLPAFPDWVVDVAHDPRQAVDGAPANQCSSYRSGSARHFVELDPAGNLIRAQ